jgi:uncharacterized protein
LDSELAFDWDDANRDHIAHHQISPDEAEQVIDNDPLDLDAQTFDGEQRIPSIGRTDQGRFLVVITTLRRSRIRVVTAFPAPKNLIDLYYTFKGAGA